MRVTENAPAPSSVAVTTPGSTSCFVPASTRTVVGQNSTFPVGTAPAGCAAENRPLTTTWVTSAGYDTADPYTAAGCAGTTTPPPSAVT